MNKQRKEKRLDELISQTINTEKPRFDPEKWKQKYPNEYQTLISRATKKALTHRPNIWRIILRNPITKIAAAALIIVAASLFLGRGRHIPSGPTAEPRLIAQSTLKKMSLMSLRMAYQRGGFNALDRQFRDTLDAPGPQSLNISMQELLEGVNGF